MTLKHDNRRDVPEWLATLNPGKLAETDLPLINILTDSLYYPAAAFDGNPVKCLGGFIHSFVYVDYGVAETAVTREVAAKGFRGYRLVGEKILREADLAPAGWTPKIPARFQNEADELNRMALQIDPAVFGRWYIFDRKDGLEDDHGPSRFSLLYIGGDGIATYQAIYLRNNIAPLALAIILIEYGHGHVYGPAFTDPAGFMAETVLRMGCAPPKYFVCGQVGIVQSFWPDAYPHLVELFPDDRGIGVWRQ